MDREAWQASVHGVAESDTTEKLTHTHTRTHTEYRMGKLRQRDSACVSPWPQLILWLCRLKVACKRLLFLCRVVAFV